MVPRVTNSAGSPLMLSSSSLAHRLLYTHCSNKVKNPPQTPAVVHLPPPAPLLLMIHYLMDAIISWVV